MDANLDLGPIHPCYCGQGEGFDHEWETIDDSFSHEYGTEVIVFDVCKNCELTRESDLQLYSEDY